MQSYYSNPHQLQAAVAAAAAGGGGGGTQRGLPFQSPFLGLHDAAGRRSPHLRGLHGGASENTTAVICGGSNSAQRPSGSLDEINESEMESDILSENEDDEDDEDDDVNEVDAETKLESSSSTNQSKLKRKEEEADEEEEGDGDGEDGAPRPSPQNLCSASKRLRESADDDDEGGGGGGEGGGEGGGAGGSGQEDEQTTRQTEIKVQRPLGLLAQHGLSMKTMATTTSSAAAALKTQEFDHRNHHHHHHHGGGSERWERERRGSSPGHHQDPMASAADRGQLEGLDRREDKEEEDEGLVTAAGGLDFSGQMSLMDRRFMPSPPPPSLASPNGIDIHGGKRPSTPSGHHWTFEEQFKQLYEMSSELKRKEFLDDLFTFMQKRGTPVNRIPIMAKQTLDLYELFRLVVSKGGLVEVINKKLWREITKGLNLPSSITSAAFTLRTQYMKYLYPYECDKLKLSTLSELQSAIDGNRREGRRPGYGYDFSPIPTLLPTPPTPHLNGPLHPLASVRPPTGLSPKDEERSLLQSGHLRSLAEHDARAMEVATRAMEDLVNKRMDEASRAAAIASSGVMTSNGVVMTSPIVNCSAAAAAAAVSKYDEMSALKRPSTMFEDERFLAHMGMHNTHIKLNSRSNGRLEYDSSMVVTMEINGMMYQGVLFAQHPRRI